MNLRHVRKAARRRKFGWRCPVDERGWSPPCTVVDALGCRSCEPNIAGSRNAPGSPGSRGGSAQVSKEVTASTTASRVQLSAARQFG